ncbi:choice-of-anchor K domain-containing protein [Iningainema tapete]|uniref:Choice-of-anchor K domain-containing protein n=1 Tax=Iningainema tapete BLCC-T55 TaxID=2748662 RepID=A0A8J7C716_9CYAN|nr:choice-of-anchor K domain-containing protein [Iningainema tapete]MBD2772636.1 choice-of-anchor K domain-containing protein [Iningainema tapete BLCC-T55]
MKPSSVLTNTLSTVAVTILTALGFSSQAQSLTISGNSSGTWGIPNPGSINTNPVYSGVGTNSFTWGEPIIDDTVDIGTPVNRLTFSGQSFSADIDYLFKVGNLTYFNGRVPPGTNVESVPLNLSLSLTNPISLNEVINFDFELENTNNLPENTPEQNADIVYVKNKLGERSFTLNGEQYLLDLIGFSQDEGDSSVSQFRVLEGEATTAGVFARITRQTPTEQIPEPATITGLSVLSIYLLVSRKKLLRNFQGLSASEKDT